MIALALCFQIKNLATLGRRRSLLPARMAVEVVKAQVANLRQQGDRKVASVANNHIVILEP